RRQGFPGAFARGPARRPPGSRNRDRADLLRGRLPPRQAGPRARAGLGGEVSLLATRRTEPASPGFAPVRMDDVEIGSPLPALSPGGQGTGTPYGSALCLVRLHGRPIGLIEVELPAAGLTPDALAGRIQAELGEELARHRREDGLPPCELDADGIPGPSVPRCVALREQPRDDAPTVSVVICTRNRPE